MQVSYKPSFVRALKKLPPSLRQEVLEVIAVFRQDPFDPSLKTHKLQGKLRGRWSFSVNYRYRIVFRFEGSDHVHLLVIGDHDVYQ